MFEIHIPSFIFGIFCCAAIIVSAFFGRLAMIDSECCEYDEDEYDDYDEYYDEEVSEDD